MFHAVQTRKKNLPELISTRIKDAIVSGQLRPGDRLPTEKELAEQFNVSRIVVREGFKILEASGLIMIKPGSGKFVKELTAKPMADSLSTILRQRKTSIEELTESRLIFEPSIARLAAERNSIDDIRKLETNIEEASLLVQSKSSPSEKNIEFHTLIAEATHNTVISLTMRALFEVLKEMTVDLGVNIEDSLKVSKGAIADHKRLLVVLREREPAKSYNLMMDHIRKVQAQFKKRRDFDL